MTEINYKAPKFSSEFIFDTFLKRKYTVNSTVDLTPLYHEDFVLSPGKSVVPPLALQPFLGNKPWTLISLINLSLLLNESKTMKGLVPIFNSFHSDFDFVKEGEMESSFKWQMYHLMSFNSKKFRRFMDSKENKERIKQLIDSNLSLSKEELPEKRYQIVVQFFGKQYIEALHKLLNIPSQFVQNENGIYFKFFDSLKSSLTQNKDDGVFLDFLKPFAEDLDEFNSWRSGIYFQIKKGFSFKYKDPLYWPNSEVFQDNFALPEVSKMPLPQNKEELNDCFELLAERSQKIQKFTSMSASVGFITSLGQLFEISKNNSEVKERLLNFLMEGNLKNYLTSESLDNICSSPSSYSKVEIKREKVKELFKEINEALLNKNLTPSLLKNEMKSRF